MDKTLELVLELLRSEKRNASAYASIHAMRKDKSKEQEFVRMLNTFERIIKQLESWKEIKNG